MNLFEPHLEILPKPQQELWRELEPVSKLGFVLYGGTAIALQLGHRQSVDFDFFSEKKLNKDLLRKTFPFFQNATLLQDREETLTISVPSKKGGIIKISFFGNLQFGRIDEPSKSSDGILQVASLDDLMATKLKVIFQRVESKDYIDIAAMIQYGISLEYGLAAASLMFGATFQPSECLKALTYFHGGDLDLLTPQTKDVLIHAAATLRDLPEVHLQSSRLSL